jgi:dTDP-4-amino-4,6-dideoxygalactose transaminase
MQSRIPFKKPFIAGKELYYITQAVTLENIAGEGYFTENSCRFFRNALGSLRCLGRFRVPQP